MDRYNCIYVKPQTGQSTYKFDIMYDQCGSKPDLNGRFYENNIVIQYDKDLIEVSNVFLKSKKTHKNKTSILVFDLKKKSCIIGLGFKSNKPNT